MWASNRQVSFISSLSAGRPSVTNLSLRSSAPRASSATKAHATLVDLRGLLIDVKLHHGPNDQGRHNRHFTARGKKTGYTSGSRSLRANEEEMPSLIGLGIPRPLLSR